MYIPASFQVQDEAVLLDFIDRYPFATLVSTTLNGPFGSHVPLLLDRNRRSLLGHVARSNPHWKSFDGLSPTLAIFHGPHAYISPTWYATSPAVPTWNYAAVHIYGAGRLVNEQQLAEIVNRLVEQYESGQPAPWAYDLPSPMRENLLASIVGFEIPIERIEGKFKLGQNRSEADRQSMLARLQKGGNAEQELAAFIVEQQRRDDERT